MTESEELCSFSGRFSLQKEILMMRPLTEHQKIQFHCLWNDLRSVCSEAEGYPRVAGARPKAAADRSERT